MAGYWDFYSCMSVLLAVFVSQTLALQCQEQGRRKYYCATYEYCCKGRCCESITQFYRLWYFWLCVILVLLFCSGGGYWYHRRYLQQRMIIGPPQTTTIITMTTTTTATADGTCMGIPTGMTYLPCETTARGELGPNQAPPPYSTIARHEHIYLTPQGAAYSAAPCGPPPSYDSVFKMSSHGRPRVTRSAGPQGQYSHPYEYELL